MICMSGKKNLRLHTFEPCGISCGSKSFSRRGNKRFCYFCILVKEKDLTRALTKLEELEKISHFETKNLKPSRTSVLIG